jgi:hypothetical protein
MNKFRYSTPRNMPISSENLICDLQSVAKKLNTVKLTQSMYSKHGKYDPSTICRRFGTWNKALLNIGIKSGNISYYSDEELFENILNIWQFKGKQPTRRDLSIEPSKISQTPYNRRFISWTTAIKEFINYANRKDIVSVSNNSINKNQNKNGRDPNLRLRYQVLKRDNFTCVQCGASPAKDQKVELQVDHIISWSRGGKTEISNLRTLCMKCNSGKSNL